MGVVADIMGRNLRLFFRDRMNVFFSLLAALLVFLLYILFLGNLQADSIAASMPHAHAGDARAFVDSWMFAGVVTLTAMTTSLGALAVFVDDAATGRFRDFLVSPLKRWQLVLGYLLSTVVISLIMTLVVLAVSLGYLYFVDGIVLGVDEIARALAWIGLTCVAFAALWAFVASFLHTTGAFAALSAIVGTLIGFLAGAYIPVGLFPDGVRNVVNALPFAQATTLLRREFTSETLSALVGGNQEAIDALGEFNGVVAVIGEWEVAVPYVVAVLATLTIAFTALAAWRIRARIA